MTIERDWVCIYVKFTGCDHGFVLMKENVHGHMQKYLGKYQDACNLLSNISEKNKRKKGGRKILILVLDQYICF